MDITNINSKEKVYTFLQSHALGVLSTISSDNTPYASPIYFIIDEKLNFYFLTKSDTTKALNIKNNKNVALTVIHPSQPITVQATGSVEEVQEPEILTKIAEANAQEKGGFSWPPPLSKLQSDGYLLMYKLQPNWLRVGNFTETQEPTDVQKNIFHQIIPQQNAT